jgi:hypothetical protein
MKTYEFEGAKYEETGVWGPPQTGEVFLADMSCFLTSGRAMRACYNYCASRRILRPVEEGFKVGDRVKSKLNGAEAEILEVRGKKMVLRFDDNSSGLWHGRDCFTPVIPTPDTVTIGSTTYRKLKSLSPISVIRSVNDSICPAIKQGIEDYADRFNSLYSEPNLTDVLDWCKTGPKRLGWAIKEGYIERVEKLKEKRVAIVKSKLRRSLGGDYIMDNSHPILLPLNTDIDIKFEWEE